jgi:hypothetical protein
MTGAGRLSSGPQPVMANAAPLCLSCRSIARGPRRRGISLLTAPRVSWGNPIPASRYPYAGIDLAQQRRCAMALFVGLDVSLKTTSICVVSADGSPVWEGKAESEPTSLVQGANKLACRYCACWDRGMSAVRMVVRGVG